MRKRRIVFLVAMLAVLSVASGCGSSRSNLELEPQRKGVLTVATADLDVPGFWEPVAVPGRYGGFEGELAQLLADELGLERVDVVEVPFADIAAGDLGGADLALTQMTPTAARERNVDFTDPYLSAPPGVLVRRSVYDEGGPVDVARLQELRFVVTTTSTLSEVVADRIRPDADPLVVADRAAELAALDAGRADAVLLDLPVAQGLAERDPDRYGVLGQLTGDEGLAAVLSEGSDDVEAVDAAIRALRADRSIERLASRWLGGDPDSVPLVRSDD